MCENFSVNSNEEQFLNSRKVPNAKDRYGKDLTFADTSDFFRSPYDYLYFAKKVGFRVYPIIFDQNGSKRQLKNFNDIFTRGTINSFYPKGCRGRADRLLLVCHKEPVNSSVVALDTASVNCNNVYSRSNIKRVLKKVISKVSSN